MTRGGARILLSAIIAVTLTASAFAADFVYEGIKSKDSFKIARFRLSGAIIADDPDRVRRVLKQTSLRGRDGYDRIVVSLDSPGGSYHAGLDLALLFRRNGIATEVAAGASCYSACAIAFLGGSEPLRDPTATEDGDVPSQPPNRSMDPSAKIGFHAPYLDISDGNYSNVVVEDAYRRAVFGITRFISVLNHLYVPVAEAPRLLKPGRDELYLLDRVDGIRWLDVDYTDYSLQFRNLPGYSSSMIANACINRYYHLQRRSSIEGYAVARSTREEFVAGSKLLGNGEDKMAFGVRDMRQGTVATWVAFMPIAKTSDDKNFIWCIFDPGKGIPRTFYRSAGTVAELFAQTHKKRNDVFALSEGALKIGDDGYSSGTWLRVLDMVPADTKLDEVAAQVATYLREEKYLSGK